MNRLRAVMAADMDTEARLQQIVILIGNTMVADVCSIYRRTSDDRLELIATQGLRQDAVHRTFLSLEEGLVGKIAMSAQPHSIQDAPRHPDFSYRPETGEDPYHAFLGVPLLRSGRVIGVLTVQNQTARQYQDDEVDSLQTIAMVLAELRSVFMHSSIPDVPEKRLGVAFQVSQKGLLALSETGQIHEDDRAEVQAVKDVLIETIEDLEVGCADSNAFSFLRIIASRYHRALNAEIISIDKLYCYGVRLSNASLKIKAEISLGHLPEPSVHIGEALDSVLVIHGPMILGTERGRELIQRSRDYSRTQAEIEAYKAASLEMSAIAIAQSNFLEEDAADFIMGSNNDLGVGTHPERSGDIAEASNFNFLQFIGKIVTSPITGTTIGTVSGAALLGSTSGQIAVSNIANLLDECLHFLTVSEPHLRGMIAATGSDLAWVASLIDWVKRKND